MTNNVNQQPNEQKCRNTNLTEKRVIHLIVLSFGVLCMTQAILNISLRVTHSSTQTPVPTDGNATNFGKQNQKKDVETDCDIKFPGHCNALVESFNKLVRDKNLLEDRVSQLRNEIGQVKAERDRLKMNLRELSCRVSTQRCPRGWLELNRRCYFLSNDRKTWEESRNFCQSNAGDLVVINSRLEQESLYRLNGNALLSFWIGLQNANGTFRWVDGSALDQTFWKIGQPDHGGLNNCVEMNYQDPVLSNWNDVPCGHTRQWLCEKDPCDSL